MESTLSLNNIFKYLLVIVDFKVKYKAMFKFPRLHVLLINRKAY